MAKRKSKPKSAFDNVYVKAGAVTVGLVLLYGMFNKSKASGIKQATSPFLSSLSKNSITSAKAGTGCPPGKSFYKGFCIGNDSYDKIQKEAAALEADRLKKIAEEQKKGKIKAGITTVGAAVGSIFLPGVGSMVGGAVGAFVGNMGVGIADHIKPVPKLAAGEKVKISETKLHSLKTQGGGVRF